jgi:hypothetical protein
MRWQKFRSQAGSRRNRATAPIRLTLRRIRAASSTLETYQLISISGVVYDDLNGNGKRDSGEPGQAGWAVELFDSNGDLITTTDSASDGSYSFTGIGPGEYSIEEILQAGWTTTQPVSPDGYDFLAESGLDLSGVNFGNIAVAGNVPEPSTWALLLLGFAGLGGTGYARAKRAREASAA